ncbi:MAG: RNase adapter RapZ [Micropruina sp.]|uniref:RNase adapter RapZ n=1 Tax=Micropruina sp. TaxID=2737536 RepID=UPI0039E57411
MSTPTSALRFVIVTGMSGAGRRTACHTLEDLGWYVVDNLPPQLLPGLVQIAKERDFSKVAVGLDVRTRSAFQQIPATFDALGRAGVVPQILFLDADDHAIVRRQESVRRPLPLQGEGGLLDGATKERRMLATLRASADVVIDTSDLNVHQLSDRVAHALDSDEDVDILFTVMSFGFKNGIPIDADMVFDVRFLPNPHWVPDLRPQTGLSQAVSSYVLGQDGAADFLDHVTDLLVLIKSGYLREGKRLATVAVGCTGGKHRSTAMAVALAGRLRDRGVVSQVFHRDLGKE